MKPAAVSEPLPVLLPWTMGQPSCRQFLQAGRTGSGKRKPTHTVINSANQVRKLSTPPPLARRPKPERQDSTVLLMFNTHTHTHTHTHTLSSRGPWLAYSPNQPSREGRHWQRGGGPSQHQGYGVLSSSSLAVALTGSSNTWGHHKKSALPSSVLFCAASTLEKIGRTHKQNPDGKPWPACESSLWPEHQNSCSAPLGAWASAQDTLSSQGQPRVCVSVTLTAHACTAH